MKKVTLPKQGSVSVKLRKQKRNRKVLVLPKNFTKLLAMSPPEARILTSATSIGSQILSEDTSFHMKSVSWQKRKFECSRMCFPKCLYIVCHHFSHPILCVISLSVVIFFSKVKLDLFWQGSIQDEFVDPLTWRPWTLSIQYGLFK